MAASSLNSFNSGKNEDSYRRQFAMTEGSGHTQKFSDGNCLDNYFWQREDRYPNP